MIIIVCFSSLILNVYHTIYRKQNKTKQNTPEANFIGLRLLLDIRFTHGILRIFVVGNGSTFVLLITGKGFETMDPIETVKLDHCNDILTFPMSFVRYPSDAMHSKAELSRD